MIGSSLLNNELHYNGLMTDWRLSLKSRKEGLQVFCPYCVVLFMIENMSHQ